MNDRTLERLMIDRSLGALPPDVDELLDAYLATRPGAPEDFGPVVAAARAAMKQTEQATPPPLESFRIELYEERPRRRGEFLRLAACVLLACGATAWFLKSNTNSATAPPIVKQIESHPPTPSVASAVAPEAPRATALPTQKQLVETQSKISRRQAPVRVVWHSPAQLPKLGDRQ